MSSYRFKLSELFLAFSEILGLIYSERPDKERSTPTSSSSEEELGNSSFLALSIYFLRLSFSLMYSYRILLISCYFSSSLMSMGISSTLFFETYSIFLVFWPFIGLSELLGFYLDFEGCNVGSSYIFIGSEIYYFWLIYKLYFLIFKLQSIFQLIL